MAAIKISNKMMVITPQGFLYQGRSLFLCLSFISKYLMRSSMLISLIEKSLFFLYT